MGVSENSDTPKSSILIGFSIINHPFGIPLFLETSMLTIGWIFCLQTSIEFQAPWQESRDPSQQSIDVRWGFCVVGKPGWETMQG